MQRYAPNRLLSLRRPLRALRGPTVTDGSSPQWLTSSLATTADDQPAELVQVARAVIEDVAFAADSRAAILKANGDTSTAETLRSHIAAALKAELGMT